MLGIYNQSFNNMYLNQNYEYGESVMNPYQQQSSLFSQYSNGYSNGYQQSNNINFSQNSILNLLLPLLLELFGNSQQQSPVTNTNNITSIVNTNSGQNNIFNTIINKLVNSSTAASTSTTGKTPVTIDEETVEITPKEPEKVFLFGNDKYAYNEGNFFNTFRKYHPDVMKEFDKVSLSPEAKKALDNYSQDNKKTVIISDDGELIGIEDTSELSKLMGGVALGKAANGDDKGKSAENTAKGKTFKFDGKTYEVEANTFMSPLTFDLNGDGVKTSDKLIQYDINGDGKLDTINDVADGTLTIHGGKDGKDLFGNNTDLDSDGKADGFKNGFDALKALALKEGLINGKDDMKLDAADLKVLKDKYQMAIKTEGYNSEAKSLEDIGITEIDLSKENETVETFNFDGKENLLMKQDGATFKINGEEREYADVWHAVK